MVCLLNSCLYVMFRSCFESLASVVPIKLVRAAHCGAPRIAVRRAFRHTVRTWAVVGKNDWQFSNPRIDTVPKAYIMELKVPGLWGRNVCYIWGQGYMRS